MEIGGKEEARKTHRERWEKWAEGVTMGHQFSWFSFVNFAFLFHFCFAFFDRNGSYGKVLWVDKQ